MEKPIREDGNCCDGMAMSITVGALYTHIQLGQLLITSPDNEHAFIVNYCPWCGTQVNDDINIPLLS